MNCLPLLGISLLLLQVWSTFALAQEKILVTAFRVNPVALSLLGTEAADMLATSLPTGSLVIPKTIVAQELTLRQWSEPLSAQQLGALSRALGAQAYVRGAIFIGLPRRGQTASVELAMELIDANEESVVGGIVPDHVTIKVGVEQQSETLAQAVRDLVGKSALQLQRMPLATGRVLAADQSGDIHLSIGHRQGVRRGTRFTVIRRVVDKATSTASFVRVGEVVVRSTGELSAIARSTDRKVNIQPLDTVTQIYELKASKELLELLKG